MALINKSHPEISNSTSERGFVFMTLNNRGFAFTKGAVIKFDLRHGKFLHFDESEGGIWTFFQDDNPDGFLLQKECRYGRLSIDNKALVRLFRKKTRYTEGTIRFMLRPTNAKVNGFTVVEVITSKPYDSIVK